MEVDFICGCKHDVRIEDIGWWLEVSTDREGFVICVAHRQRRKKWHALPTVNGNDSWSDYDYAKYSPLQIEQNLLFGKAFPAPHLHLEPNTTPDLRDNRDPETVGLQVLAGGNGHGK